MWIGIIEDYNIWVIFFLFIPALSFRCKNILLSKLKTLKKLFFNKLQYCLEHTKFHAVAEYFHKLSCYMYTMANVHVSVYNSNRQQSLWL